MRLKARPTDIHRRAFLRQGAALTGFAVAGPLQALAARAQEAPPRGVGATPGRAGDRAPTTVRCSPRSTKRPACPC